MPSIPTYNQQVNEQAIGNSRVNTAAPIEAFGGGEAGAAPTKALQQTLSIVQEERAKADKLKIQESDVKLAKIKNDLIYNNKDGLITKKGKNAFGAHEDLGKKYQDAIGSLEKEMSSPTQQAEFRARVNEHKNDLDLSINKHVSQESVRYADEVYGASKKTYAEEAILNHDNPFKVEENIAKIKKLTADHGEVTGKDSKVVELEQKEAVSYTRAGIIENMLQNDKDVDAQNYFKNNKKDFTAQDYARLEKTLEEGSLRGNSQRKVDELMSKGLSMTAGLEEIRKIQDPKLRDATQDRFRGDFAVRKAAQDEAKTQVYNSLANQIEAAKGDIAVAQKSRAWGALDLNQKESLMNWSQKLREGKTIATDLETYTVIGAMSTNPDLQEKFLKTNMLEYRDKLSTTDLKKFTDLQNDIRKGDTSKVADVRTRQQIVKQTASLAGIDAKDDSEAAYKLNREVDEQIQALEAKGEKVDNKKIQQIVDGLVIPATVQGSGFFGMFQTKKPIFEVGEDEDLVVEYKSIPQSDKLAIRGVLQKKGIPQTEANIQKVYTQNQIKKVRQN